MSLNKKTALLSSSLRMICTDFDGTIAELPASAGAQVTEGQMLLRVEAEPSAS